MSMPPSRQPVLLRGLRDDAPGLRRCLRAAVASDQPDLHQLQAAGVPHYTASDCLRRLRDAGELTPSGWHPAARDAYRAALEDAQADGGRLERLHSQERPREKAEFAGVAALGDAELLALVLRTGTADDDVLELAERVLIDGQGLPGLAGLEVDEWQQHRGIGPAKAAELAAAFELGRRVHAARRRERPSLATPEAVVALLGAELAALRHEEFWCLPLDARSHLLGEPRRVSRGDVDGTEAGPRSFFRLAVQAGAVTAIAVHNHPTGDPSPSAADRAVTSRLITAGKALDLALVDHVIIGDGGRYVSLRRSEPRLWGA